MKKILTIVFLTLSFQTYAQKIEYTFSIPGDSTQNYYITVHPKEKIKGAIVLLPGFGGLPKGELIETDIEKYAAHAGFLTIVPALGDWSFFYMDETSHQKLNQFISTIFKKYNLNEKSFFIGGMSLGGTM